MKTSFSPDPVFAAKESKRLQKMPTAVAIADMLANPAYGDISLVSSFGADSAVLLHMVAQTNPHQPVLFIDTGKLFPQTLAYQRDLVAHLGLTNVQTISPDARDISAQDADDALWLRNASTCCALRKVAPLAQALVGVTSWMTGRKAFQNISRAALEIVEVVDGRYKLNPLIGWSAAHINEYLTMHQLPRHPLVERGYLSIGCQPCTTPVRPGEDARAGRWRDAEKTECGIHVAAHAA
jgi:phosphoadenosine phosphosulfate reductase